MERARAPPGLRPPDSTSPESPTHPDHPGNRLKEYLRPVPDLLVVKQVNSAFHGSADLAAWLSASDISGIVVCGIATNHRCETSARVGGSLGLRRPLRARRNPHLRRRWTRRHPPERRQTGPHDRHEPAQRVRPRRYDRTAAGRRRCRQPRPASRHLTPRALKPLMDPAATSRSTLQEGPPRRWRDPTSQPASQRRRLVPSP